MRSSCLLMAILLTVVGTAQATDPPAAPASPAEDAPVPEELASFFEEIDDDGHPILDARNREYLLGLPAHAQRLLVSAVDDGLLNGAHQLRTLLAVELTPQEAELLFGDNCVLCHSDPDFQDETTLLWAGEQPPGSPAHLNLDEMANDVHFRRGLACAGCHGGRSTDTEMADEIYERWPPAPDRHEDRTWIPDFCSRCHADPTFMRTFNPALPTDQLAKYATSQHGLRLLQQEDSKAAQCVSCHGNHGIRSSKSRRSRTHPQNIPTTCGACHDDAQYMSGYLIEDGSPLPTNQLDEYRQSVHGRALLEDGDLGAPACNDCHGNHAAIPPAVASVSQICRTCHAANGQLFDGSNHKQAFERNGWPECERCHGKHDIEKTSDDMLAYEPGHLCYDCHRTYASDNPECGQTTQHFRQTIELLVASEDDFREQTEALAAKGLDVDPLIAVNSELHDAMRTARSRIHSFDRSDFDKVASVGLVAIERGEELISQAREEHRFRRAGLMIAIGWMVLLALAIYLRLRQIERRS